MRGVSVQIVQISWCGLVKLNYTTDFFGKSSPQSVVTGELQPAIVFYMDSVAKTLMYIRRDAMYLQKLSSSYIKQLICLSKITQVNDNTWSMKICSRVF